MKKTNNTLLAIITILLCLGLWSGGMFLTHWYAIKYFTVLEGDSRALLGDSFGAVNALISAFAFAGVIFSMYLQRNDLELQRESLDIQKEELKRNTNELALQRQEFETQNKTIKLQRFENTFFNMLTLQQEIISELNYTDADGNNSVGRSVFEAIYSYRLRNPFGLVPEYLNGLIDYILRYSYFELMNLSYFQSLNHYFTHLYHIISYIDSSHLLDSEEERYNYVRILRATLSKYELYLLYFNCLNFPDFKKLVEKYSLLKYVPDYFLLDDYKINQIKKLHEEFKNSAFYPEENGFNKA